MSIIENPRILVVSPHPDDEAIYFGGAIAEYSRRGAEIDLLVLTDGSKGKIADTDPETGQIIGRTASPEEIPWFIYQRRNETLLAADILGISRINFLGIPDQGIDYKVVPQIREEIEYFDPHIIISFSEAGTTGPYNPDHSWSGITTYFAIKSLLEDKLPNVEAITHPLAGSFRKYFSYIMPSVSAKYERWAEIATLDNELTYIHLDNAIKEIKKRAMLIHTSQRHLIQFFINAGLIDLNPETYLERINIGGSSKGQTSLDYGFGEDGHSLTIEEIPGSPERYLSTEPQFYEEMKLRSLQTQAVIYSRQIPSDRKILAYSEIKSLPTVSP